MICMYILVYIICILYYTFAFVCVGVYVCMLFLSFLHNVKIFYFVYFSGTRVRVTLRYLRVSSYYP